MSIRPVHSCLFDACYQGRDKLCPVMMTTLSPRQQTKGPQADTLKADNTELSNNFKCHQKPSDGSLKEIDHFLSKLCLQSNLTANLDNSLLSNNDETDDEEEKEEKEEDADREIREAFDYFDRGKRGFIDAIDLKRVLSELGVVCSDSHVQSMLREGDFNGDGVIHFHEFKIMMDLASE